jgi:predicted ribosome quality control (RQC) complex YloA/Tae2 family protein
MKYLKYFESKKEKFPDIQQKEIDGYTIFIGKDAKSNDYLTFNVADKEDMWFHVKGKPGSHVVIIVRENLLTPEIIKTAALLAKKNSKAKGDNQCIVVYCKKKFVKKKKGMNDGQVKVDYKNSEEIIV